MTWLRAQQVKKSLLAAVVGGILVFTQTASADVGTERANPVAKGTVGLALLGAEAVMTIEAIAKVKPWWAYAIGGGVGAIAGGIGGYFIDTKVDKPAVSMGLLVGGLVLAIPTTIAVLSATTYKPPKNPEEDQSAEQRAFEQWQAAQFAAAPSAFQITEKGSFHLGVPAVAVVPVYSQETAQIFALKNAASFRVPVLSLSF